MKKKNNNRQHHRGTGQKKDIAINKKKKDLLKDEGWKYGKEEEDIIDYGLFIIRELTGKLY